MKKALFLPFICLLLWLVPDSTLLAQCISDPDLGYVCLETDLENTGCIFLGNPTVSIDDEANTLDWLRNRKYAEYQANIGKTYNLSVSLTSMPLSTYDRLGDVLLRAGDEVLADAELIMTAESATVGNFRVDFEISFEDLHLVAADNFAFPIYIDFTSFSSGNSLHFLSFPLIISGSDMVNNGEILGYTQAPEIPYLVLHKPPGDQSSTTFTEGSQTCFGFSMSTNSELNSSIDASIKVGAKVQTGFIVSAESEVYAEASASLSMGIGQESGSETNYCIYTENSYTTGQEDLFLVMAPNYAIGLADVVRVECGTASLKRQIVLARQNTQNLQLLTATEVRDFRIPGLEREIEQSSGLEREKKQAQLDIWRQTLRMLSNASLNATAPLSLRDENGAPLRNSISFSGGGGGATVTQESSSSRTETINTTFFMASEVAVRAGFEVAGSGAEVGVSVGVSLGGSNGTTTVNESVNSISYHLQDDSSGDLITASVGTDPVFGTPVFSLRPDSRTSCPYEGGLRRFQPRLRVDGNRTSTVITRADRAGHFFDVEVCNDTETNESQAYLLQVPNATNATILRGTESLVASGNNGVSTGTIPANQCVTLSIQIRPGSPTDEAYEDITIALFGDCELGAEEERSEISVSIYFGDAGVLANDNPCRAVLLPVDGSITASTYAGATVLPGEQAIANGIPSFPSNSAIRTDAIAGWAGNSLRHTVWYKFQAPASGQIDISTCQFGTDSPAFAVYAVDGDEAGCSNFANYTLLGAYTMDNNRDCANLGLINGLSPGRTYFILVNGRSPAGFADFGIRLQEGAAIDLEVTFRVDLTGQTLTSGELYLYGDFAVLAGFPSNTSPSSALMPMTDPDGDNIYEITVNLPNMPTAGRTFDYIYVDGIPNPAFLWEDRNGSCFTDGDIFNIDSRRFTTPTNGSLTQVFNDCYGSCDCNLDFTPACDNWDAVGQEGDQLTFSGQKLLRYGRPGNYAYGTFENTANCAAANFPSVSPSSENACWICQGSTQPDLSSGAGKGLLGVYYAGTNFEERVFSRIDETVDFSWGNEPPATTLGTEEYSVRWEGEVEAGHTETYTFYTTTDDGVRLWVNDELLIDQWIGQAPTEHSGSIDLVAGQRVAIRMEYFEGFGEATARLSWSSTNQMKQIIPKRNLFPAEELLMGCSNPALDFDGRNDFVDLGKEVGNFGNGDFTVELRVKTSQDLAGTNFSHVPLAGKRSECGCDTPFWYIEQNTAGTVNIFLSSNNCQTGGSLTTTSVINDGQWHHLALVRSRDVISLYFDGALEAAGEIPGFSIDLTNDAALRLGYSDCTTAGFGGSFDGQLDEFRVWTKARSTTELQETLHKELGGNELDLAAYYPFNDGVPNEDNSNRNASKDASAQNGLARLRNFSRDGNNSNWVVGDDDLLQLDRNQNAIYDACDAAPPIFITSARELNIAGATLGQNYPNPTNGTTHIPVTLPSQVKRAELRINSFYGRTVKRLPLTGSGEQNVRLSLDDLPAGIYVYSLIVNNRLAGSKRLVITR